MLYAAERAVLASTQQEIVRRLALLSLLDLAASVRVRCLAARFVYLLPHDAPTPGLWVGGITDADDRPLASSLEDLGLEDDLASTAVVAALQGLRDAVGLVEVPGGYRLDLEHVLSVVRPVDVSWPPELPAPQYTDGPGQLPALPVGEGHVALVLRVENSYELHDDITTWCTAVVPRPPVPLSEAGEPEYPGYGDWAWEHVHPLTGAGHPGGDSWHDVEVLASSDPNVVPVGTRFDFGY